MQDIRELIQDIDQGGRAAHAFVVEGMAGETREAFVRTPALALRCPGAAEGVGARRPCLCCPSCRQVAAGTSLDLVTLTKSRASASAQPSYKVADVAAFIERLSMGAYGRYLIGIIEDADSMSEVVQNKLLKTLEEPAPNTVIFLATSNRDNLLETVRSRCSDIRLDSFDLSELESLESGGDSSSESHLELANRFLTRQGKYYELRTALDKHIKSKDEAFSFLDLLEDTFHSGMMGKTDHQCEEICTYLQTATNSPEDFAHALELVNIARMDIHQDMSYLRALRRLYLELC